MTTGFLQFKDLVAARRGTLNATYSLSDLEKIEHSPEEITGTTLPFTGPAEALMYAQAIIDSLGDAELLELTSSEIKELNVDLASIKDYLGVDSMSLTMPTNNLVELTVYFSVPWKLVTQVEFDDFWSSLTVREKYYYLTTPIPRPITHP